MKVLDMAVVIVVMLEALGLALSVRVVKQYMFGVLFRLGRVLGPRGPGLHLIVPLVDALHRVSLRIMTMPAQSRIITRDNVSVDVPVVAFSSPVPASGAANG
jgi:regulator of protease activity HflC (stomatin/prohibitin superfamily)